MLPFSNSFITHLYLSKLRVVPSQFPCLYGQATPLPFCGLLIVHSYIGHRWRGLMQWFALGKTFANFHYAVFVRFSEETCSDEVPAECAEFIPYTTYPNTLYGLNGTDEYTDFSDRITAALHNCTNVDPFWARWGVCNMMFPRCLLGFELQLCQETCLGKSTLRLPVYIHTTTAMSVVSR